MKLGHTLEGRSTFVVLREKCEAVRNAWVIDGIVRCEL